MLTYCILLSTCKGFPLVHKTFQYQNINLHKFTKRFYQQKLRDYILQKHVDGFLPFNPTGTISDHVTLNMFIQTQLLFSSLLKTGRSFLRKSAIDMTGEKPLVNFMGT